jgi:hypothetical protein
MKSDLDTDTDLDTDKKKVLARELSKSVSKSKKEDHSTPSVHRLLGNVEKLQYCSFLPIPHSSPSQPAFLLVPLQG